LISELSDIDAVLRAILSFKIVKTISKAILHQNQNQHDKDEKI
jgi:hypothetical protein